MYFVEPVIQLVQVIQSFNFVPRYDTKKSVWIMDAKTHAYKEGLLV